MGKNEGLRRGADQPTTFLFVVVGPASIGFPGLAYRSRWGWANHGDRWFGALTVTAAVGTVLTGLIGLMEFPSRSPWSFS